jgi:hypothetical protein
MKLNFKCPCPGNCVNSKISLECDIKVLFLHERNNVILRGEFVLTAEERPRNTVE